ncbi:MAG: glycosyltransferase [Anaerolineae bacterium]|jgi:GT2 family glycosyltransferase|nr:glycosyltransferase [Anaerolineae bacterium]
MDIQDITVIVPTRNESHNIERFLASLPPAVKLIVVDASQDRTVPLIRLARPANTRIICSDAHIAAARHIGASAATARWLLFCDADITFAPDYFERLAELEEKDHAMIYGPKRSVDHYAWYYRLFQSWQAGMQAIGIPAASGSNLLIRRLDYHAVGGFDQILTVNEDTEIGWRIARRGMRTRFEPTLVVYARDQRRLNKGVLRKTVHSLVRCTFLYLDLIPPARRGDDWGYWSG